ncbi:MAG: hypothetical protein ACRD4D_08200, partial [Candidatus Acidiferrales bacterium]
GITLFVVGSLRTLVTRARWFVSGLEMLRVGSVAATTARATLGASVVTHFGFNPSRCCGTLGTPWQGPRG